MAMFACPWMRRAVPGASGAAVPGASGASGAVGCMYGTANVFNASGGVFIPLFK